MEAHLRLEVKLDQELWMVIAYYISYISKPQMKKFAEKHEKCVFSYNLSKIDTLFENIPNPEPTVHSLAGRS